MKHRLANAPASSLLLVLGIIFCAASASAQQITYYTFDDAAGKFSYNSCQDPAVNIEALNPLLCFNDASTPFNSGTGANPSLSQDNYPDFIDPNGNDETSSYNALLLNPAESGHAENMWFSVPQKVRNGFTSYFAFKLVPSDSSYATGDGIAFVLQNAQGGGGVDPDSGCQELPGSSGPNVQGSGGGCLGYSGIDNSLALEFDTYTNNAQPTEGNPHPLTSNDPGLDNSPANHIALQSCGTGVNSTSHGSNGCSLALNNNLGITLADGFVHEIVVEYSGDTGDPDTAHKLSIYLDPAFVEGTHTPRPCTEEEINDEICRNPSNPDSDPIISVTYDLGQHLNLLGGDSAYVGFTGASGAAFEAQEIMAWTFTPHTTSQQQQPLKTDGTTTTFPFGDHTYGVTYPTNVDTNNIDMIVTAHTVSPEEFASLVAGSPQYSSSVCQVYDGTGGNCVIYSTSCVKHTDPGQPDDTTEPWPCPTPTNPNDYITIKSAYENTIQPISPGFLEGDPLRSLIDNISGNGLEATVTCTGECPVTLNQSVNIVDNSNSGFNGTVTVATKTDVNKFTFSSGVTGTGTGGYLNSNNIQDICDPANCYVPQRIDGTTTGRTKNFSDFVATGITPIAFTSAPNTTATVGSPLNFPITATGAPAPAVTQDSGTLPSGIQLLASVLSGTPDVGTGGVYNVTFRAHNGLAPDVTQGFQLTVNEGPSFTSASSTTFTAGTGGSFSVTANGYPAPTFDLLSGTLPSGVNLSPAGALTSTATAAAGTYNFTLRATNTVSSATQAFTLTIQAAPSRLTISPTSINFGTVQRYLLIPRIITVKNTGTQKVQFTRISITRGTGTDSHTFTLVNGCPTFLLPGRTCAVALAFYPNIDGPVSGSVDFTDTASGSPQHVPLSATVIDPQPKFFPSSLDFGTQKLNSSTTKPIVLKNLGTTPLLIRDIKITGNNTSDFKESDNCPSSLAANHSCTINVTFTPKAKTSRSACLTVLDNAWDGSQTVNLTGRGK